ncbi:MAG: histidine kinase [Candidatus Eisenbacteria bacterium]
MSETVQHRLEERVKELSALHQTARLLQSTARPAEEVVQDVVELLPFAWQHTSVTAARIRFGVRSWATRGFEITPWIQREELSIPNGDTGSIEVVYLEETPTEDEGPFLREERDLIRSLSELLRAFFQRQLDAALIRDTNERLERLVAERTASLRRLASEVCLAEERERRRIAEGLHDHLGQALAVMKIRLKQLRGDAILGGHGSALGELVVLSEQAIQYTRELTFELSPPILYELGLGPALEWLGEETAKKHGLEIRVRNEAKCTLPGDLNVMLWKSARELLHNVLKHAEAHHVAMTLSKRERRIVLEVEDDGVGFRPEQVRPDSDDRFGLFSIEERIRQLGGEMAIESAPGRGTLVRLVTGEVLEEF